MLKKYTTCNIYSKSNHLYFNTFNTWSLYVVTPLYRSCYIPRCLQTALLYAAKHNHHLMVADLISFGANVNTVNNSGKSCLHLSAEKGYVRVLEVRELLSLLCSQKERSCCMTLCQIKNSPKTMNFTF